MVQINAAESNRASLHFLKEATWGVTPGTGIVKEMRLTKSKLVQEKGTKVSEEIRADRMVSNIIEVSGSSGGPVEYEKSAGSQDDMWEEFLLTSWTLPMSHLLIKGSIVSVASTSTFQIAGTDYRDWLTVGKFVKLEGFANLENNGYHEISAKAFTSGNTVITVVGTPLVVEAGSAYTKVIDASDVFAKLSTVTFTSGNTIESGGTSEFAAAGLKIGQKIYVEGLGKETGTLVCGATDPTPGDTFTISDGVDSLIFEINTSSALVTAGHVYVASSGTEATLAANIAAAVNAQFNRKKFRVTATVVSATVTLKNHRGTGGSIAESTTTLTGTNFSGGSATKSGFYTIASLPDDDTIVVSETLSTDANSGTLNVVIKGSHIRNPGDPANIVKQSATIETGFGDVAKYFTMAGQRIDGIEEQVRAGDIVGGKMTFMGGAVSHSDLPVLNQPLTYTVLASTSTEVLNATSNVGTVKKDGVELELAVMSISLKANNNLREQRAVGEKFPAGIGYGRFTLSGEISVYFENFDFYDAFNDHETISLGLNFEDVDNSTYFYTIPALKITSDPISPEGIDKDVMEDMSWQAQRDPTLNTQFMMDRFSSVWPTASLV